MAADYSIIEDYVIRLRQSADDDQIIREFRQHYKHRFQELCMMHLSILIDIPWDFFDQRQHDHTPRSALKRLLAGPKVNPQSTRIDAVPAAVAQNIIDLIDRLDIDEVCSTEGIFRKAGHTLRKRQMQEALLQPNFMTSLFPWEDYTVHDLASALKSVLANLNSPLLTNRLLFLFHRVAALHQIHPSKSAPSNPLSKSELVQCTKVPTQSANNALIESKQLKALRLLLQMLPAQNAKVLKRLLQLLTRTAQMEEKNRMSSISLGMVFGPVLFPVASTHESSTAFKFSRSVLYELQEQYQQSAHLCVILIDTGPDIFRLPRSLADDVHVNSARLASAYALHPGGWCKQDRYDFSPVACAEPKGNFIHFPRTSPSIISHGHDQPNEESPPLMTGIRFATPVDLSAFTNNHVDCSSAASQGSNSCSPKRKHSIIKDSDNNLFTRNSDAVTRAATSVPTFAQSSTPSYTPDRLPCMIGDPTFTTKSATLIHRRSSLTVLRFRDEVTSQNHDDDAVKPHVPITELGNPFDGKPVKKRRYTEMKLPSRVHQKEPRKNIFSPCPPLRFFPFRRAFIEKRGMPAPELAPHYLEAPVI